MAAEHTIRELSLNALRAGVSARTVRGVINSFAEAASTPLLYATDVDPLLAADDLVAGTFLEDLDGRSA